MTQAEGKKRRLIEVDRVTGFAIFLVVVGHIVAREPPLDNQWYVHLKFNIYQFHMPLFMFMSGLVFPYTYTPISTLAEYRSWVVKKITRLAPGFLIIGTAITLGKLYFGNIMHVDNPPGDVLYGFTSLLIAPTESAAGSLWYIYVLLEFYLLFPILRVVCRNNAVVILAVTVAMHAAHLLVRLPRHFALHDVFEFALYFWLGAMACAHYDRILAFLERRGPIFAGLFLASYATTLFLWWTHSQTIVGLASIPALLWLVGLNTGRFGRFFAFISQYTFVIYLLNTIVIGLAKGLMLKVLPWDGVNFFLYFVVLLCAGLTVPILAQRWVFARNRILGRIMN